jgi:hypothetical protein
MSVASNIRGFLGHHCRRRFPRASGKKVLRLLSQHQSYTGDMFHLILSFKDPHQIVMDHVKIFPCYIVKSRFTLFLYIVVHKLKKR